MTDKNSAPLARRRFLKMVSSGALAAPVIGLAGCGGDDSSSTAPAPAASRPAAEPAPASTTPEPAPVETPAPQAQPAAPASTEGMPQLAESDPQAQALSYIADASTVDAGKFPQYSAGNACSNCALYTGADGSENGPCSIFPGKLVSAKGWCSVYAPKM